LRGRILLFSPLRLQNSAGIGTASGDIGVSFCLKRAGRRFCRSPENSARTVKTGKKREMRRDYDRFPPESGCGLSYQGSRRPRIVRGSGMPVCGDWQFVINF
jgi:hypothetical protein